MSLIVMGLALSMGALAQRGQSATPSEKGTGSYTTGPQDRPELSGRLPGELARKLESIELFDRPDLASPDRQLDIGPGEGKSVKFADALPDLAGYANQEIAWDPCVGPGTYCAKVLAPLDWDNPGEAAIELKVALAASAKREHDPIFVNPGGPGAPGVGYALSIPRDMWPGYDLIGWDPRGTGESTHVVCGDVAQTDAIHELDGSPDDEAEDTALQQGAREFARQCREHSGKLLDHISSVDVARDMDLLRHLVGAKKFNFFGVSYGTYIGAMYATLFPDTSGRMVLDGAVEITDQEPVYQVEGFELAFRNWADWCASTQDCKLHGGTSQEIQQRISDWLASLDANPIAVGSRTLTQTYAALGIALFLYDTSSVYPELANVVDEAMQGRGGELLAAADRLNSRGPENWETLAFAFPAMRCADERDAGIAESKQSAADAARRAPMLGRHMGGEYVCQLWSVKGSPAWKLDAKGAEPILVVGSTGDSATPYQQAVRMAEQLEGARLLTYDGPGHGVVTSNNRCISEAVGSYFAEGNLPQEGKTCK